MPGPLKNQRRERFCWNYISGKAQGLSNGKIYALSGYTVKNVEAADVNACRLLQQPDIRGRLIELGRPAAERAQLDAGHFIDKFERVFEGSLASEQFGTANRSAELQARISGVLTDKLEVSIEYGGARNAREITADLLREFGSVAELRAFCHDLVEQAEVLASASAKAIGAGLMIQTSGKEQQDQSAEVEVERLG